MKRVLILGDSISMGYREMVKENLRGKAEVFYFEENGRFSAYTYWLANQWLIANGTPDIVHWNNGIWDITKEGPLGENFAPLEEYAFHLERTVRLFQRAGVPNIIFATTTYQHPDWAGTTAEDVERYNRRAIEIMAHEGVAINDLGGLVKEKLFAFLNEDQLHLNEAGYRACAEQVTKMIEARL